MTKKDKSAQAVHPSVVYELRSVNLASLPEKEQGSVLDRFASFLDSLTEPISFHIVQDEREVESIGAVYRIPYRRFFLRTESQVDSLVATLGTRMTRVHGLPAIIPRAVHPKFIEDSRGEFVQTYAVTRLGGNIAPGFLAQLYQVAYSINVDVDPVGIYDAKKTVRSYARSLGSRLILRQNEGRSLDPEEQAEFERASRAAQLIGAGKERLFRTRIRVVLREKDLRGPRREQEEAQAARRRDGWAGRLAIILPGTPPDWRGSEVRHGEVVLRHHIGRSEPLPILRAGHR